MEFIAANFAPVMFAGLIVFLILGFPVAFSLGAAGLFFALVGVGVFFLCFVIIDKLTPHDLWGEIVEKRNVALAIVVGSMCIAIGMIISAAVHG